MSLSEPSLKRSRDVSQDIKKVNRPMIKEDFHSLLLGMLKGQTECQTELETRAQDLDDLLLVKFQEEVLPGVMAGIRVKIVKEAKRGSSVTSATFKWNYMPYYSVEQGETTIDLSRSGRRTDMVLLEIRKQFPKMQIQNTYAGPLIMWLEK